MSGYSDVAYSEYCRLQFVLKSQYSILLVNLIQQYPSVCVNGKSSGRNLGYQLNYGCRVLLVLILPQVSHNLAGMARVQTILIEFNRDTKIGNWMNLELWQLLQYSDIESHFSQ